MSCEQPRKRARVGQKAPELCVDVVTRILAYLSFAEHLLVRRTSKTWIKASRRASAWALVPLDLGACSGTRTELWWRAFFSFLESLQVAPKFTFFDATKLRECDLPGLAACGVTTWSTCGFQKLVPFCSLVTPHLKQPKRIAVTNQMRFVLQGFPDVQLHLTSKDHLQDFFGHPNVSLHYYPALTGKLKVEARYNVESVVRHGRNQPTRIKCDNEDRDHACQLCECSGDRLCFLTTFTGVGVADE